MEINIKEKMIEGVKNEYFDEIMVENILVMYYNIIKN